MKTYLKSYAVFLAMVLVTNMVIRPAVQKFQVPLLKDSL